MSMHTAGHSRRPGWLAWVGYLMIVAVIGSMSLSFWDTRDAGYNYAVQDTLQGDIRSFFDTGFHFKTPFFTKTTEYKQVATLSFGNDEGEGRTRVTRAYDHGVSVTFADTYTATIPVTVRYRLPRNGDQFLALHREYRGFDNLVDNMLVKITRDVVVMTAQQYAGEEFFQGGVNQFKAQLEDQLRNGTYKTERRQVAIEAMQTEPVSSENNDPNKFTKQTRYVYKNVPVADPESGLPQRLSNSLEAFGIEVSQITIGKPLPSARLDELLDNSRKLVADRIAATQKIETLRAEAKAAEQEKEIDKARAIQEAEKAKEIAIIAEQQKTALERELSEREKVRKQKELDIARAERDIQKAASEAASFEAQKLKSVGLAEAEVERAKLSAKQAARDIYMAEIDLKKAQIIYPAMRSIQVKMPQVLNVGSEGKIPTNSLELMTTLGSIDLLKKTASDPGH